MNEWMDGKGIKDDDWQRKLIRPSSRREVGRVGCLAVDGGLAAVLLLTSRLEVKAVTATIGG